MSSGYCRTKNRVPKTRTIALAVRTTNARVARGGTENVASPDTCTSCDVTVTTVAGASITTLEGLGQNGKLHPVQQAWVDEQVPACGYCQNGQILTATALLTKTPNPTDAQIRQGMATTLCRCMTYYRIQAAIKRAAKVMATA